MAKLKTLVIPHIRTFGKSVRAVEDNMTRCVARMPSDSDHRINHMLTQIDKHFVRVSLSTIVENTL